MDGYRFPRCCRIGSSSEIKQLSYLLPLGSNVCWKLITNTRLDDNGPRFAVSVGKKVSVLAVERNRIKRQAREIFRHARPHLPLFKDYLVVARQMCAKSPAVDLREYLQQLFVQDFV